MLFLALAVACSLGIAMLFKVAERRDLDRTALLTVNYAAGAVLAAALQGVGRAEGLDAGLVGLGVAQGVLFIAGFWLFARAIREAGMGLAAGVMRLSVVVPVLASWQIWGEAPSGAQLGGLALAGGAFFLIARPAAQAPGKLGPSAEAALAEAALAGRASPRPAAAMGRGGAVLLLGLLFLTGGLVDVLHKAFATGYAETVSPSLFLLFVFGVAFAIGAVVVGWTGARTGRWPGHAEIGWGAVLGVINYGSADFLLRAVEQLSGPFVFPANSVAIVFGAAILGRLIWGEQLSRANVGGLALAALALVLLAG